MAKTPPELRYTNTHEWAKAADGEVLVGITEFAIEQLHDLVFLNLPKPNTRVERGKRFGEIESVKAVAELFSPVTGTVTAANDALATDLERLAKDAYGAGWLIRVKPDTPSVAEALAGLLDPAEYAKLCEAHQAH